MQKTIIVVPCYNEEQRLNLAEFRDFLEFSQSSLLFVNDGSSDNTLQILHDFQNEQDNKQILVLNLPRNQGKAEAVRQGMLYALSNGADIIGYWDADLATPVKEFLGILETIQKDASVSAVFGSRVRLLGHDIQRTLLRHYLGRGFATIASLILQLPIYDTQCGAKVFRGNAGLALSLKYPFHSSWAFDIELIYRLLNTSQRELRLLPSQIREIPLMKWQDVKGSKLKPSAVFGVLVFLIRFGIEARILRKKF